MRKVKFKLYLVAFYPKKCYEGVNPHSKGARKTITTGWLPGRFHCFSSSWEELNEGVGQYPVALVEDEKGHVHEIATHHLKFVKED